MDQNFLLTTMISTIRNQISRLDSEYLAEYHLTYQQYSVLTILSTKAKMLGISSLAECIGVRQPTMTGIIKRLEQKGLVSKKSSASDTRCTQLALTNKAKKLLAKINSKHSFLDETLFEALSTSEKKQLARLLSKLMPHH